MLTRFPLLTFAPDDMPSGGGGSEPAPAVVQDTPDIPVNTPEGTGGTEAPTTDYEQRYKASQAWSTRVSQENAALKERVAILDALGSDDPKAQAEALAQFGIQLDYEDAPAPDTQPASGLAPDERAMLDALFEQQQAQAAELQEQQQYRAYRDLVDPELTRMGLDPDLHDIVAEAAMNLPALTDEFGQPHPDLEGALAQVTEWANRLGKLPGVEQQRLEQYRQSKQAPAISESGTAGTQVPNLANREERQALMRERWNALANDA